MVVQQESHKHLMINRDDQLETVAAFAVNNSRPGFSTSERSTYKHCGKFGHDEAGCFELIG